MNRKLIPIVFIALVAVAAGGLYFGRVLKSKNNTSVKTETVIPTAATVEMTTWKDQSEFEFAYPKNLKLDSHPEDNENYAHLELSYDKVPGTIVLWTKDSKYKTVDDYLKGNKIANYVGSTLGSLPAAKILDASDNNKYSILTVRNGYLYQIDVDSRGESSWNSIFNSLADSYKFADSSTLEKEDSGDSAPAPVASDDSGTEEEVIE